MIGNAKKGPKFAAASESHAAVPRCKDSVVASALADLLHRSNRKMPEIAAALSKETGQRITVNMLYRYCSESKPDSRFPAELLNALSDLLGDDRLLRLVLGARRRELLALGEAASAVLGEHAATNLLRQQKAERRKKKLSRPDSRQQRLVGKIKSRRK